MPTAVVTGAPERVPDIVIALKSAGFDILAAGVMSPEDAPDIEPGSVDCYVQFPNEGPPPDGRGLRRTRAVIAHELLARFDTAARFLPLLAPGASVVLVSQAGGADPDPDPVGGRASADADADADRRARRTLAGILAEAIMRECGRAGVRASVIGEDRAPEEIAAAAADRPAALPPWWQYADVDPELDFADWRNSVLCLASLHDR